jgi:hypothetical protein
MEAPLSYFPPIPVFASILKQEKPVFYPGEIFPRQTLRNRCYISGPGGLQKLIIPLKGRKSASRYGDLFPEPGNFWRKIHFKSLEAAYRKSPFFEYYEAEIQELIFDESKSLFELNLSIHKWLFSIFSAKETKTAHWEINTEESHPKGFFFEKKWMDGYPQLPEYLQTFGTGRIQPETSMLDLFFNQGPEGRHYLDEIFDLIPERKRPEQGSD